jgi:hypothetical protein
VSASAAVRVPPPALTVMFCVRSVAEPRASVPPSKVMAPVPRAELPAAEIVPALIVVPPV